MITQRIGRNKYKGLTKKQYKREYGSETPGSEKGENCKATGLDKAMAKNPRSYKTFPTLYVGWYLKKHRSASAKNYHSKCYLT